MDDQIIKLKVRSHLAAHARLAVDAANLEDNQDLYGAGLTSLTTVNLMLALEDHFDIEFDDAMLTQGTFQSINAICQGIVDLIPLSEN